MIATAVKKPKRKEETEIVGQKRAPPLSEDRVYINAIIPKTKGSKLGMKLTEAADSGRDLLIIANILPGGLADESKLKQGMILYTVNGKLTEGKSAMEVARMLAGAEGTVTVVAIADKNEIEEKAKQKNMTMNENFRIGSSSQKYPEKRRRNRMMKRIR
ncbi:unknown protein [Seminavis robusta]|uniref:PDZ domain-containing protein n=1 Tax=Seminavis robusta TaxID=568900 RepID=A0A9N8HZK7_9STRA|nr:unknown protein [Seminavis robusta]|eukprot:Sro3712_g350570.1 n/a (159) ;mRNA; f:245-797